jgi:hypothetical protein
MLYAHTDGGVSAIRCEHSEILGRFAPDVHIDLNSDFLSRTTFGSVKLVVS